MNETGIVRRIDELGRVVIPKEMRRVLKIKEGEQMEIIARDDTLILRKYNQIHSTCEEIERMCEVLGENTGKDVFVCDRHVVISHSGKDDLTGQEISVRLYDLLDDRTPKRLGGDLELVTGKNTEDEEYYVSPILSGGDLYGGLVLKAEKIEDIDVAMCDVASEFLSRSIGQ